MVVDFFWFCWIVVGFLIIFEYGLVSNFGGGWFVFCYCVCGCNFYLFCGLFGVLIYVLVDFGRNDIFCRVVWFVFVSVS